jgi:hypothetical protein
MDPAQGTDRFHARLFGTFSCIDDEIDPENPARATDALVDSLDLAGTHSENPIRGVNMLRVFHLAFDY